MDKAYKPQSIETGWYKHWEQKNYFNPQGESTGYCIMLPPPNITGSLHMGHAFQHTLIDILIRYHRMRGYKTLWQCGTDHAGIATQIVVERQLEQQGTDRHTIGYEQFIKTVWDWKKQSGSTITQQLRRLGTSMDWSREHFTLDQELSKKVTETFVKLYKKNLIYRKERLVNWDPVLQTALSDLEVIPTAEDGKIWYIRYKTDNNKHITVATTRPETILGDIALAVHPEDQRYQQLIGRTAQLPSFNGKICQRQIPIIADQYVDPDFGTGCVKITPAHDFNDYQVWQRHKNDALLQNAPLKGLIKIFDKTAKTFSKETAIAEQRDRNHKQSQQSSTVDNSEESIWEFVQQYIPEEYRGKDRYTVRKQILHDLQAEKLLEKEQPHQHMVPRSDRSGEIIEPYLIQQWYISIESLADPARKAVKNGHIQFIPEHWSKTYFEWMDNIQDWCISRQIWWGHRIPAWYDIEGNYYVATTEEEARQQLKKYRQKNPTQQGKSEQLHQDTDVLDTWFSSALWPFATLNKSEKDMQDFYPTNVLVTGFDIIFFWVARMIMMGLECTGNIPFEKVYIHGLVRDAQGQKMSKSKGNVLDPIDLIDGIGLAELIKKRTTGLMNPKNATTIEKATRRQFPQGIAAYGTDALRMTFASLASQGRDVNFDVGRIGGYRNFCNKLWNATRYIMIALADQKTITTQTKQDKQQGIAEHWIKARLMQTTKQVTENLQNYRFDLAVKAIHEFTWDEYCDWYLEFSKIRLSDSDSSDAEKAATHYTLIDTLETLLRLAHPFMPFITEEIWQKIQNIQKNQSDQATATIMYADYPKATGITAEDKNILAEITWIKTFIIGVRRIRAERDISPKKTLSVSIQGGTEQENHWLNANLHYIKPIANIDSIKKINNTPDDTVITLAGAMTLLVPLADLIDLKTELDRLEKAIKKLQKDNENNHKKLQNKQFIERAPAAIIEKTQQTLATNKISIEKLQAQQQRIKQTTN